MQDAQASLEQSESFDILMQMVQVERNWSQFRIREIRNMSGEDHLGRSNNFRRVLHI